MSTKDAAKHVRKLYDAAQAVVAAPEGSDAAKAAISKMEATLPEAKQALEVLGRRFP